MAYHGSPNLFDHFDLSFGKAGTGIEAYGRGVYVTDCPGNATHYARRLRIMQDGRPILSDRYVDRGLGTGNYHADCLLVRFRGVAGALQWLSSGDRETPYGWEGVDLDRLSDFLSPLRHRISVRTVGFRYRVRVEADNFLDLERGFPAFLEPDAARLTGFARVLASEAADPVQATARAIFVAREKMGKPLSLELMNRGIHGVRIFDAERSAIEWTVFDAGRVTIESVEDLFPQEEALAA